MLIILLTALAIILAGGSLALCLGSWPRLANRLGAASAVLGCLLGLVPALLTLWRGDSASLALSWQPPLGSFALLLDPLAAFFLLPILLLAGLAALYGAEYLPAAGHHAPGPAWFFYNLLAVSLVLVVLAHNGLLFLAAWELMALSSFFLVTLDDGKEPVRRAGLTYLVATHLGTAFLLAFFLLLGGAAGSLDFAPLAAAGPGAPAAGLLFVLALVGFGTKAGFLPLHVWLPEAHPAAPSHVSALMSGVMIKTGVYGLVRALTLLGRPEPWWGWLLIGVGLASGVLGVLFALAQHDLKRLLAYHSVENLGIIALGLGAGVLGLALDQPALAVLGFGGGLLHVLNHALFKGLLFLGAGAVANAAGTRELDRLGGLLKAMPWTGGLFLLGSLAICGLPPLNGFASEFLIYLGALEGLGTAGAAAWCVGIIAGLALIGGLAAACFTKACGVVFLGEPRHPQPPAADPGWAMRSAMLILALGCVAVGLLAPLVLRALEPALAAATGLAPDRVAAGLARAVSPLAWVAGISLLAAALAAGLAVLRRRLLKGREVGRAGTWDCGYLAPTPRMQYTASSFAQPLTALFGVFLQSRRNWRPPLGWFPREAAFAQETDDLFTRRLYLPALKGAGWLLTRLHWLQRGRVQVYVLYLAATLFGLAVWHLR